MEDDKVETALSERLSSRRRFAKSLGAAALGTAVGAPLIGAAQAKAEGTLSTKEIEEHLPASVVTSSAKPFSLSPSGLTLAGTADHNQLVVKANATQSANVLVLQNSAEQSLFTVNPKGELDTRLEGAHPLHHLGNIAGAGFYAASHYFYGSNGKGPSGLAWSMGVDVAAATPYRDWFLARAEADGSLTDFLYLSNDNGNGAIASGVGVTPPYPKYALSVSGKDSDLTQGGIAIRVHTSLTGKPFALIDSASGNPFLWVDASYAFNTVAGSNGVVFKPEATNRRLISFAQEGSPAFTLYYNGPGENAGLRLRCITSGRDIFQVENTGTVYFYYPVTLGSGLADATNIKLGTSTGTKIGTATNQKLAFFGATPIVQPAKPAESYAAIIEVLEKLGLCA